MKVKLFTFIFTLMASAGTLLADAVLIDGLYYNLDDDNQTAEVTTNPDTYSGDIIIPSSLEYGTLTYSVTSIGVNAFRNCNGVTNVTIPNSVTNIAKKAFQNCTSLTAVTLPEGLTRIGAYAFSATGVKSVTIPEGITIIDTCLFYNCKSLESVSLPGGLTKIMLGAFENSTLASVFIPKNVNYLGDAVFMQCYSLKSVYCAATTPPTVYSQTFYKISSSAVLHVPYESIDLYKAQSYYNTRFADIQGFSDVINITTNQATLTWRPDSAVVEYTIQIYSGESLFATYTVNGKGEVTSSHRPSPGIIRMPMDTTVSTTEYYVITLEDLTEDNEYRYTIDGTNTEGNLVYHEEGTFRTAVADGFATTPADCTRRSTRKIFRDGQILILTDDKTYSPSGIEIQRQSYQRTKDEH